jgi:hypothetical protein
MVVLFEGSEIEPLTLLPPRNWWLVELAEPANRATLREPPGTHLLRATGLSRTYCGMIRRGVRVPHAALDALRKLVG